MTRLSVKFSMWKRPYPDAPLYLNGSMRIIKKKQFKEGHTLSPIVRPSVPNE